MLLDVPQIQQLRVVLASASPRRIELMRQIGLTPRVHVSGFAEDLDKSQFPSPAAYATETARRKALDVATSTAAYDILVAADSIVICPAGNVLEKPKNTADAQQMLARLSGRRHAVSTGVAVVIAFNSGEVIRTDMPPGVAVEELSRDSEGRSRLCLTFSSTTAVTMGSLAPSLVDAYVSEPQNWSGKAGGYGIQDTAGAFVSGIEGDYYTVVGLPLHSLSILLRAVMTSGLAWNGPA